MRCDSAAEISWPKILKENTFGTIPKTITASQFLYSKNENCDVNTSVPPNRIAFCNLS